YIGGSAAVKERRVLPKLAPMWQLRDMQEEKKLHSESGNSEWSNKRLGRESKLIRQRLNFIVIPIDRPGRNQYSNSAGKHYIDRDSLAWVSGPSEGRPP